MRDSCDLPLQFARQTDTAEFKRNFRKYRYTAFLYTYLGFRLSHPFFSDKRVSRSLKEWACVVEIRNPNWLNAENFDVLASHGLGNVFLQGYYMPPVAPIYARFADKLTGTGVIRLHGPDREGMEERTGKDWSKIVRHRYIGIPCTSTRA